MPVHPPGNDPADDREAAASAGRRASEALQVLRAKLGYTSMVSLVLRDTSDLIHAQVAGAAEGQTQALVEALRQAQAEQSAAQAQATERSADPEAARALDEATARVQALERALQR